MKKQLADSDKYFVISNKTFSILNIKNHALRLSTEITLQIAHF